MYKPYIIKVDKIIFMLFSYNIAVDCVTRLFYPLTQGEKKGLNESA